MSAVRQSIRQLARRTARLVRDLDLLVAFAVAPAVKRYRASRRPVPASTLVLPAVPPGGFGDGAVVGGARAALEDAHPSAPFGIASHQKGDATRWGVPYSTEVDLSSWFGRPRLSGWASLARAALRFDRLVFTGTDVFDGSYSDPHTWVRVLRAADRLGMQTRVVSFSCSKHPRPDAIRTLRKLPSAARLMSRDPLSQSRTEQFLSRSVERCADLAFVLPPASAPPDQFVDPPDWLREAGPAIGLNINPSLVMGTTGFTIDDCTEAAGRVIALLAQEMKVSVVLIPHDTRGEPNELEVAAMIMRRLPPALRSSCASSTARTAAEAKTLCRSLDLVVTGRMHLAVGSLSVATPVLCASYQDKVEGLLESCGVPELAFAPSLFADPSQLISLIHRTWLRRAEIGTTISAHLPDVEKLATGCMT